MRITSIICLISALIFICSCGRNSIVQSNESGNTKDDSGEVIENVENADSLIVHCDGIHVIGYSELFKIDQSIQCCLIDSANMGSLQHINIITEWIKIVDIKKIGVRSNLFCNEKNISKLRGQKIFNQLLIKLLNDPEALACDLVDAHGYSSSIYAGSVFYSHIIQMIQNVDGESYDDFFNREMKLYKKTLLSPEERFQECNGHYVRHLITQLQNLYREDKIILKPFNS